MSIVRFSPCNLCLETLPRPRPSATDSFKASLLPNSSHTSGRNFCLLKNSSPVIRVSDPFSRRMNRRLESSVNGTAVRFANESEVGAMSTIKTPVAVTRHGQTVGYFIPTQGQLEADITALKKASKTLDRLLESHSVDLEEIVADFKIARKSSASPKKLKLKAT
jgi:hypothetical protein